jgi:hypothetical protein
LDLDLEIGNWELQPQHMQPHILPMGMPPTVTQPGNADPAAVAAHHRQSQRGPDPFAKHQRVSASSRPE